MRIVGGAFRGRRLSPPEGRGVRPTSDRAREAVFNRLAHGPWVAEHGDPFDGARVLDAFAGTGALGLEALSRGAAQAWFVDRSRRSLELARANATTLGVEDRCRFQAAVLPRAPAPPADGPVSLVFLDPPYGRALVPPTLARLAEAGWLAEGALVVAERAVDERDGLEGLGPAGFTLVDDRRSGAGRLAVLFFTRPA